MKTSNQKKGHTGIAQEIPPVSISSRGFAYSQKRPYKKINKMWDRLLDICQWSPVEAERKRAFAQFKIMQGTARVSDYNKSDAFIREGVIAAVKWLNCEIEDEALFSDAAPYDAQAMFEAVLHLACTTPPIHKNKQKNL